VHVRKGWALLLIAHYLSRFSAVTAINCVAKFVPKYCAKRNEKIESCKINWSKKIPAMAGLDVHSFSSIKTF
jgi:hypothetical protein